MKLFVIIQCLTQPVFDALQSCHSLRLVTMLPDITCPKAEERNHTVTNTSLAVYGTYLQYSCQKGYIFPDGHLTAVIWCGEDGNWMGEVDHCQCTLTLHILQ